MSLRFTIDAKAETAELFIYDDIGFSLFSDGVTAKAVADTLKDMKSVKNLTVRINSYGGDVFEGLAIKSQLASSGKHITMKIDGIAASIASVIAMAGNEIHLADGGFIMIHDAWTGAVGNAEDLRKQADTLDKVSGEIAGIYAKRTKSGEDEMRKLMKEETWLTAGVALEKGFITAIGEPMNMAAKIDPTKFKYRNIPQALLQTVEEQVEVPVAEPVAVEPVKDDAYYRHLIADELHKSKRGK
jgi:ATP-dependent Clp protease protease subunit